MIPTHLPATFLKKLESYCNSNIVDFSNRGASSFTSTAFIKTKSGRQLFLKYGNADHTFDLLHSEYVGLQLLGNSISAVAVPEVSGFDTVENRTFLLLEYIPSRQPLRKDFVQLAKGLAQLHSNKSEFCGLDQNNFIGSLPQKNTQIASWPHFYSECRLSPQIDMAIAKGLLSTSEIPNNQDLTSAVNDKLPDVKPSLLHGDLWNGNYLIHRDGRPFLIDPSVYYGDPLIDIAMSQLFGGFSTDFYDVYYAESEMKESQQLLTIYQLYYLLVHLNLFGTSYKTGVMNGLDVLMR